VKREKQIEKNYNLNLRGNPLREKRTISYVNLQGKGRNKKEGKSSREAHLTFKNAWNALSDINLPQRIKSRSFSPLAAL